MATEQKRKEYGETANGYVVVITKQSFTDDGLGTVLSYQVRQGAHTVTETPNAKAADTLAKSLVEAG
jgi:hypothetical protein